MSRGRRTRRHEVSNQRDITSELRPIPMATVQTTVYRHWTEEHSRMRLDGPMLDRIVGVGSQPLLLP